MLGVSNDCLLTRRFQQQGILFGRDKIHQTLEDESSSLVVPIRRRQLYQLRSQSSKSESQVFGLGSETIPLPCSCTDNRISRNLFVTQL